MRTDAGKKSPGTGCLFSKSLGCRAHPATLFGTAPAEGSAILAVLCLMLGALVTARLAHLGTELAKRSSEITAPSHEGGSQTTNLGAVHVERDTARHHLDVVFMQAGRRAHIACVGTGVASFDTRLILLLHDVLLE
jgi:hypothetical protein